MLGNAFLIKAGLNAIYFVTDKLEKLASTDFGTLQLVQPSSKIKKLTAQLLCFQEETLFVDPDHVNTVEKLCTLIKNSYLPLRNGDDIGRKDVSIGSQNDTELQFTIMEIIKRAGRHLSTLCQSRLRDIVSKASDVFRIKLLEDPPAESRR